MMKFSQLQVIVAAGALATVASLAAPSFAAVVSFGSGGNQFNMEFVMIGNPNNAADTTGEPNPAGAVGYEYGIGKFEVSEDMIAKYNANFGTANSLAITLQDMTSYGGNSHNKPATGVSWNEAARFVNWLNTSTGNQAAYKFTTGGVNDDIALWTSGDAGYDANNLYRNSLAKYVLPSYKEWHKAAYYDPIISTYYDYPTGSNTPPTAVASGTTAGTAVYFQSIAQGPATVDQAGGLSPYGVMGLGGNVREWEEGSQDLANSSGSSILAVRGGNWFLSFQYLMPWDPSGFDPLQKNYNTGFRVASLSSSAPPVVPEPSMMVIGTLFGIGGLVAKRRLKK
ncbi:MAG: SUMF1/EgtB/PvdO family nonheme iron enzyme [Planctomycetota bacterium]|nr:SUMF1/EgtB/PvdO family nonheme iron enzyme [Planctomycetota bacterium]